MKKLTLLLFCCFCSYALKAEEKKEKKYSVSCLRTQKSKALSYDFNLKIKAQGHYVHPDAPFSIDLEAENLSLKKKKLDRKDAVEKKKAQKATNLKFVIEAKKAEEKKLSQKLKAKLKFFICSKDICVQKKSELTCSK